jgi:hypothetical protein
MRVQKHSWRYKNKLAVPCELVNNALLPRRISFDQLDLVMGRLLHAKNGNIDFCLHRSSALIGRYLQCNAMPFTFGFKDSIVAAYTLLFATC